MKIIKWYIVSCMIVGTVVIQSTVMEDDQSEMQTDDQNMIFNEAPEIDVEKNLDDFSLQFKDNCPVGVSQFDWNNFLYQLQMMVDLALAAQPATEEDRRALIAQAGDNGVKEAQMFEQKLPALDQERMEEIKAIIYDVEGKYVEKIVSMVIASLPADIADESNQGEMEGPVVAMIDNDNDMLSESNDLSDLENQE